MHTRHVEHTPPVRYNTAPYVSRSTCGVDAMARSTHIPDRRICVRECQAIARILGSVVEQTGLVGRWPVWQGCVSPYPLLQRPRYNHRSLPPPFSPPPFHRHRLASSDLPSWPQCSHGTVRAPWRGCVALFEDLSIIFLSPL